MVSFPNILYVCWMQTSKRLSLSVQWQQTLPPTCRWVVLATSRTSWQSAGPAPPSSRTSCFRPNINYVTDWRIELNGRWSSHFNTQTHILFSYMTPQRQHRLLHYMINTKVSPAPAVGACLSLIYMQQIILMQRPWLLLTELPCGWNHRSITILKKKKKKTEKIKSFWVLQSSWLKMCDWELLWFIKDNNRLKQIAQVINVQWLVVCNNLILVKAQEETFLPGGSWYFLCCIGTFCTFLNFLYFSFLSTIFFWWSHIQHLIK